MAFAPRGGHYCHPFSVLEAVASGSGDVQIEDNETAALMEGGGGRRQKPQKRMSIAK